jgi:phosphoglycolate phosphatase
MAERYAAEVVLFDLDGTLVDTLPDLTEAANRTLVELGLPPRTQEEIATFVGQGIGELVRRALGAAVAADPAQLETALQVFRRHYAQVNGNDSRLYPGALETLETLRDAGRKLAVVTNKSSQFTLPLLERMGILSYFAAVVSGDTLPVKKPDPAMLRYALTQLGASSPTTAVMVGDSRNDALAARALEMPVFLVTYGYSEGQPIHEVPCTAYLESLPEVLNFLA